MRFGAIPVAKALGCILAHSQNVDGKRYKKGHFLSEEDIATFLAAGLSEIIVATLEPTDLAEDEAAERVARAFTTKGVNYRPPGTGRVNFHAEKAGLFTVDKALIDACNAVDPTITVATLAPFSAVQEGQLVATVKIIPFAVGEDLVSRVVALALGGQAFSVLPFKSRKVGLIQTELSSVKQSVLDKTATATSARLRRSDSRVISEMRIAHDEVALTTALGTMGPEPDMILIFGASAVSDEDDVIPSAIKHAGGTVERVGMPVDPGNLLVLGELNGVPVIGAPGCARSPVENGFDWVLDRLMAGLDVSADDLSMLGVGGLLMEIASRPHPREDKKPPKPIVPAIVLAAGRSSRMGGPNKLLAEFDGERLVHRTVRQVLASKVDGTFVVTGHQAEQIGESLSGLAVKLVHNPLSSEGLSQSLKVGIRALPSDAVGVLIALADMPDLTSETVDRLVNAFVSYGGDLVIRATHAGKRGNPVILPASAFELVEELSGDKGARDLIESGRFAIIDIEIGAAATSDVDTLEAMEAAGGILKS